MKKYVDKNALQEFVTKLTNKYHTLFSSPLKASTVAAMTDTSKVYVYTGSESGYTSGNWYYYNGSAWTSGGVYNAVAFETDKTLLIADKAADAKATGDEVTNLKTQIYETVIEVLPITIFSVGYYINANTGGSSTNSGSAYTDYFPVLPGATVTLDGVRLDGARSVYGYDAGKQPMEDIISETAETSVSFIVPENIYYIRATTSNTGTVTGTISYTDLKFVNKKQGAENAGKVLVVGENGEVTLAEVDETLTEEGVPADAKAVGDKINTVTDYIIHGEDNTLVINMTDGRYIAGDGTANANANSACTDYIPVTGGAEITLNNVNCNALRSIVAYSTNSTAAANKQRLDSGEALVGTFTTILPTWAKFVRASTTNGTVITGSEHIEINYINKALSDALDAKETADEAQETINEIPTTVYQAINNAMLQTACKAILSRPSGLTLTGLDDITVFATAASYGVTAKPDDYKNVITNAIYIDAINGEDANSGTAEHPKKTIDAAIDAGTNTIYLMDGSYTFPTNGISQDINLIGVGENVIISGGSYFTGNIDVYVENIDFDGGAFPCLLEVGVNTEKPQFCAYKCTFENSISNNGLSIKGEATVRVFECIARNNYHDGFNYHKNTSISPSSDAPNVMECGCVAYGNGSTNSSPTSDNGTTAHNYTNIIRVGGNYYNNHGGNVADNGNVKAWTVGCAASGSQKTTGDVNNADFWINANTVMYCDNCYADGSTFDGWAESSSTLYVAGGEIDNVHLDGSSTKENYTSEAVFKYLAG